MKKKQNNNLRGIVVAGDSREQAENSYRSVASGSSVSAFKDEDDSFIILSNADTGITLMNPLTGFMDLVEDTKAVSGKLEFLSADNTDKIETFYTVCSDGCGSHLIADERELMQKCPVCASDLMDLSEDEIKALEDDTTFDAEANASDGDAKYGDDLDEIYMESNSSDSLEDDAMIATGSSLDIAVSNFKDLLTGEVESSVMECTMGNIAIASSSEYTYSPYTGLDAIISEPSEYTASVSATDDEDVDSFNANVYKCVSGDCGDFVVCSNESPVFCPSCSSGLIEPEMEDDDHITAVSEDYEPEMEDDEESTSNDSEDDSSEDPDRTSSVQKWSASADSEDLEPDDSDAEPDDSDTESDDDDEDEDMDEDNSIAVSSVDTDTDTVSVDLLSIESSNGDLDHTNLSVSKVNNIGDESRWLAFYNEKPVAIATASSSKSKDTLFESETFGNLLLASAKENGVSESLNELGFKPITASASIEDYVHNEINEQVSAKTESVSNDYKDAHNDHSVRFAAALATAAEGINRNFFEDVTNPVKNALIETLASLNVRNPEKQVNKAFVKHNNTYLKNLVAKTNEIMDYDLNIQNQLTKAIAGTSTTVTASSSDTSNTLEIGKPAEQLTTKETEQHLESTSSTSKTMSVDDVLSTLGKF